MPKNSQIFEIFNTAEIIEDPITTYPFHYPQLFRFSNNIKLDKFLKRIDQDIEIVEHFFEISEELEEYENVGNLSKVNNRSQEYIQNSEGVYGVWIYIPWERLLIRYPEEKDFYKLRTSRNRNLITFKQQQKLRNTKLAFFGLSVGSNVALSIAISGIGNEYHLFDFDDLSIMNLNRMPITNFRNVSKRKITAVGERLLEIDPFVKQCHYSEGFTEDSEKTLKDSEINLIFEEVDDLQVKAKLREIAKRLRIPLVTVGDIDDIVTLDVERHDIEDVRPFNGKLNESEFELLLSEDFKNVSPELRMALLSKVVGVENVSTKLWDSLQEIGKTLTGIPQLGTTSMAAGAIATVAARDIILKKTSDSFTKAFDISGRL